MSKNFPAQQFFESWQINVPWFYISITACTNFILNYLCNCISIFHKQLLNHSLTKLMTFKNAVKTKMKYIFNQHFKYVQCNTNKVRRKRAPSPTRNRRRMGFSTVDVGRLGTVLSSLREIQIEPTSR